MPEGRESSPNIVVLHLSDIHFGMPDAPAESVGIRKALQRAIHDSLLQPDLCVFSGDLSNEGSLAQIDQGLTWLAELLHPFDAPLAIVPGNHDVNRAATDKLVLRSAAASADLYRDWRPRLLEIVPKQLDAFFQLCRPSSPRVPRLLLQWEEPGFVCTSRLSVRGLPVNIIGINSAILSCADDDTQCEEEFGKLVVDTSSLNQTLAACNSDKELTLAISHHPIRGCLTRWNAAEVEPAISKATGGVHAWLHGHLHNSAATFQSSAAGSRLLALQAGATFQSSAHPLRFSYYTFYPFENRIAVQTIVYQPIAGNWVPDGSLSNLIVAALLGQGPSTAPIHRTDPGARKLPALPDTCQSLQQLNRTVIANRVGDKYRSDLYVDRTIQSDIAAFLADSERLITKCHRILVDLLAAPLAKLQKHERSILRDSADSILKSDYVQRASSLNGAIEALLPEVYPSVRRELDEYWEYVRREAASLTTTVLRQFHDTLLALLIEMGASAKLKKHLTNILESVEEGKAFLGSVAPRPKEIHAPRMEPSHASYTPASRRRFAKIQSKFDIFLRELDLWVGRQVLVPSGDPSREQRATTKGDIITACRQALETAQRRCLVIVDAAGSGKTNLLAHMACNPSDGWPTFVVVVRSMRDKNVSLSSTLDHAARKANWASFDELVRGLENELTRRESYVLVLIDGINEHPDPAAMLDSLREFIGSYSGRRVRAIVTCRDIYWTLFKRQFLGVEYKIREGALRAYSDSELQKALHKYLTAYSINTKIEGAAYDSFRSPLLMRFFCEAYGSRHGIPSTAPYRVRWINLKRLFDDYLSRKSENIAQLRSWEGPLSKTWIRDLTIKLGLSMRESQSSLIPLQTARSSVSALSSESRIDLYEALLDEEIVIEEGNGNVYFVYEAFMEYVIAKGIVLAAVPGSAWRLVSQAAEEVPRFLNMRGVVLMLLIMLAEDRGETCFKQLLAKGSEWMPIALNAIGQLSRRSVNQDAVTALQSIAEHAKGGLQMEAAQLLLSRGGRAGRSASIELLGSPKARVQRAVDVATRRVGNARLIADLMKRGPDKVSGDALGRISPGTAAVKALISKLRDGNQEAQAVALKALANVRTGSLRRARRAAEDFLECDDLVLRENARKVVAALDNRILAGEAKRRERISRAQKRRYRNSRGRCSPKGKQKM